MLLSIVHLQNCIADIFFTEFYGLISRVDHCLLSCDTEQFGLLVSEFDERPASIFRVDLEDGGNRFIGSVGSVFL
jgi:hypothetical protein